MAHDNKKIAVLMGFGVNGVASAVPGEEVIVPSPTTDKTVSKEQRWATNWPIMDKIISPANTLFTGLSCDSSANGCAN